MGSVDTFQCACIESPGLERLRYFPRQLLTADDMRVEQEYFREKQRRHNRFLHGGGVVSGLLVMSDPKTGPLALTICPGYALGPCGDEIYVPEPVPFDLTPTTQKLAQPSCANLGVSAAALESGQLALVIRYAECQARPVRTLPAGCGCDDSACEFSRIRDGFEIRAIPKPKADGGNPATTKSLCEIEGNIAANMPAFVAKPATDWLELATVTIQAVQGGGVAALSTKSIDNGTRRVLYSTASIQAQVIQCCCGS